MNLFLKLNKHFYLLELVQYKFFLNFILLSVFPVYDKDKIKPVDEITGNFM